MRMKRSRVNEYYLRKRETRKDEQGSTYEDYASSVSFKGEVWAAGGEVQVKMYGEKLSYIRNVKIQGNYRIITDEKNHVYYVFEDGLDVAESDGVCLYVSGESKPDYKIISIKPYQPLRLECEKI